MRDKGVFDLEDGIRRVTSLPARLYGIADRGEIAPGKFADLMLFDPATVGRGAIRRVDDLPGGESRLVRDASGVHRVWVNGTRVYDENGYRRRTASRPRARPLSELTRPPPPRPEGRY